MARAKKTYRGLNKIAKKLADGSVRELFYWRGVKGVPALPGKPGDPDFEIAYRAGPPKAATSTPSTKDIFEVVLTTFEKSNEYLSLAARTKHDYGRFIKVIRAKWGSLPLVALIDEKHCDKLVAPLLAWRDEHVRRSARQGQYLWVVLTRVINVGIERKLIKLNPCAKTKVRKLYKSERASITWTREGPDNDFDAFLKVAPAHLHLPVWLALFTGQREGDLLKLRYRDGDGTTPYYDGRTVSLRSGKTKSFIAIKPLPHLKALLDAEVAKALADPDRAKKDKGCLLVSSRKTPWSEDGFRSSFNKARKKARNKDGIKAADGGNKTYHDLRGTAVTMLALAGCSTIQIASITGHSEKTVEAILNAHYLGEQAELAGTAMRKLTEWFAPRIDGAIANRVVGDKSLRKSA